MQAYSVGNRKCRRWQVEAAEAVMVEIMRDEAKQAQHPDPIRTDFIWLRSRSMLIIIAINNSRWPGQVRTVRGPSSARGARMPATRDSKGAAVDLMARRTAA